HFHALRQSIRLLPRNRGRSSSVSRAVATRGGNRMARATGRRTIVDICNPSGRTCEIRHTIPAATPDNGIHRARSTRRNQADSMKDRKYLVAAGLPAADVDEITLTLRSFEAQLEHAWAFAREDDEIDFVLADLADFGGRCARIRAL